MPEKGATESSMSRIRLCSERSLLKPFWRLWEIRYVDGAFDEAVDLGKALFVIRRPIEVGANSKLETRLSELVRLPAVCSILRENL